MKHTRLFIAALAVSAAFGLSACGEKQEQVQTVIDQVTSSASEAVGGGTANCGEGALATAVEAWAKVQGDGQQASLPGGAASFKCADGWAVAFPNVGSGQGEITVTAVFQSEGPIWVPQNREKVCGKTSPIPNSLYQDACETH